MPVSARSHKSMLFRITRIALLSACLATAGSMADEATALHADMQGGMDAEGEALATALWLAAAEGDLERLNHLLAIGAEVQAQPTGVPTSALWIAAQEGHTEIVKLLLALGANIEDQEPSDGRTALFQASQEGHPEIVNLLLEHGARVNAASASTGATPLFIAAARGHVDVVLLLLEAKANAHVVASANGIADSPSSIARKRGHAGIVELIENYSRADARPTLSWPTGEGIAH